MMNNKKDEYLFREIYDLNDILTGLVSSYRLSVGAAEEFNRISLAHRKDVEDAVDRADDLGHLVDEVRRKLKKCMRIYFSGLDYKLENLDELCEKAMMREKLGSRLGRMSEEKEGSD